MAKVPKVHSPVSVDAESQNKGKVRGGEREHANGMKRLHVPGDTF